MGNKTRKYAVVDLEATSAGSTAKIIQVGIVLIKNGKIIKRYATDVNPHQALDRHIIELTGLTDERLSKAPDFSQVAREIYELLEGTIFVAHNVKFDANLLTEELFWAGFDLLVPRVDTVELAQVFFPTIDKYGLSYLSERLDLQLEQAHTAIADAEATAQLFLKIQDKIASLPKTLVESLLARSDSLVYESRLILEEVYERMPNNPRPDLIERHGIFLRKPIKVSKPRYLSRDFVKNLALLGLEPREQQEMFAAYVDQALKQDKPSFLQAQTGLGKTYGYLLPLLAATQSQLVITVPTKILQDQIMQNEAKRIRETFQISFHNLKSPHNYIKLDRFYELLQSPLANRLWERTKLSLLIWLTETKTGDLEEIGQKYRFESFFNLLSHDGKLSKKSLFYGEDFWNLGQEQARKSRVVITNHAYFLTRLEDDQSILKGKVLVVDEAQKLFGALETLSRKRVNLLKVMQEISELLQMQHNLLWRRLLESLRFELQHQLEEFQLTGQAGLDSQALERLRQDLQELPADWLQELRQTLGERFDQFWLAEEVLPEQRVLLLEAARLDLLNFSKLLPEQTQILLVSATLEISRKVNLANLLGFDNWQFYKLPSQTSRQQALWLDRTFPDVTELSQIEYANLLAERIEQLAKLKRPILVLFTSKELLLQVSDKLELSHLAQYKNGPASNIKQRFDRGESNILLGTGSFWEGTDFVEQEQIIQVITRLPFDNPEDPFVKKVNRYLRLQKKNPFYDYSLPLAILRLKQAMGRTRRRKEQRSAVLLLDNRIRTKRYSRQIREALQQEADLMIATFTEIMSDMRSFLEKKEK